MKEFVPECVRQFVSVCLTNVNNIFCVCAFNYYRLSSFLSSFICFIRDQNRRELEAKVIKYVSMFYDHIEDKKIA